MRLSLSGLCLIALPLMSWASDPVSFVNDREGESFYKTAANKREVTRALRELSDPQIKRAFDETLETTTAVKLCAYEMNDTLLNKFREMNPKFKEFSGALYHLRFENEMDDSVLKILSNAHKTVTTSIVKKIDERTFIPNKKILEGTLPIVKDFDTKYSKNSCFDEAYRNLINDIFKVDKTIKATFLQGIFEKARDQKLISQNTFVRLEQARINELENSTQTLKTYYQKITTLRLQYPLRDPNEKSDFITMKADKLKMSQRQRLLENYTDIQIIMMGNIIKKLRSRLESPKVEILIYDRQQGKETITLEPMERFRLAIKLLRKEMSYLALNTYFAGRTPSYVDLMVASYEIGIIPASELEEVAGLQEMWDPKKTLWEKARTWVQTLSTVATIVIPPPYGFLPALAIVVIEATTEKSKSTNTNDPTSLF